MKNKVNETEYFKLYDNNKSGIYTKETWLIKNIPHIYDRINSIEGQSFSEKAYKFRFGIKDIPKCLNCVNSVIFKNKTVGYQKYCSNKCGATGTSKLVKETLFKTYGVNHSSKIPKNIIGRKDKRLEKIKLLIGNAKILSISDEEEYEIKCDLCNKVHKIERKVLDQRIYLGLDWRNCISKSYSVSNGEIELKDYIQSIYKKEIIYNDRKIIGSEIDIYIPEFKIGIEYNGLYWHSEINKKPDYHYKKYTNSLNKGITLIQIYEDEWKNKKDIIKSRIKNLLHLNNSKIYGRNCIVKEIDYRISNSFLNDNHLQGSIKSSINLGLFYKDELVSIMTFGKPRGNMSGKHNKITYELYRFCTKKYYNVIGAGSKLFKYFIKNYNDVESIYSFSSNEWSGQFYNKIGMKYKSISKISYWYIKNYIRVSRHNFNKGKLIKMGYDKNKSEHQILKELKIYRIYGAGNTKFVWNRISI